MERLINCTKLSSSPDKLLVYAVEMVDINLHEAMTLFEHLLRDIGNTIDVLCILLPQIATISDSKKILDIFISDDIVQHRLLKYKLGNAYKPLVGNYAGFYCLDLSKHYDRVCFNKLIERSNDMTYQRRKLGLGDVSQDGNWSSFRNVLFMGVKKRIDANTYDVIPHRGHVEFDFTISFRSEFSAVDALTDRRFIRLLHHLHLLPYEKSSWALLELDAMKESTEKDVGAAHWSSDMPRAVVIGDFIRHQFVGKLNERKAEYLEAFKRERVLNFDETNEGNDSDDDDTSIIAGKAVGALSRRIASPPLKSLSSIPPASSAVSTDRLNTDRNAAIAQKLSSRVTASESLQLSARDNSSLKALHAATSFSSLPALRRNSSQNSLVSAKSSIRGLLEEELSEDDDIARNEEKELNDFGLSKAEKFRERRIWDRAEKFFHLCSKLKVNDSLAESRAFAVQLNEFLEDLLSTSWLMARQLALLMIILPAGAMMRCSFASYRTELIIALFGRLVDLHNFELVLSVLTAEEHAMLFARLGFLILTNPIKPDGPIRLNLSVWEQRQVTIAK